MFTCQAITNGASYLSEHLTANDYYSEGESVVGVWVGEGAKRLGIEGQKIEAGDKIFEALRTNSHPSTGEPLTSRSGSNRRAFYDFQCSAPKSVSVMAVTFGDARLVEAHKEAVEIARAELEKYAGRRDHWSGEGNKVVTTGNIISAAFTHDASRELEAQLHTHLVTANATWDEKEGCWFALQNSQMFSAVAFAGRVYQTELASRVQALGYEIREDRENGVVKGFEIEGVSVEDCEKQSSRRKQIEAEIEKFRAEKGRAPTAPETHVMATETRGKKLAEITTPEVRAHQLGKYSEADRDRLSGLAATARDCPMQAPNRCDAREAIAHAAEHLVERNAVVTARDVLKFALQENVGRVDLSALRQALNTSSEIVRLTAPTELSDTSRITTKSELENEAESVALVGAMTGQVKPLDRGAALSPDLGEDQRQAVQDILATRNGVHAMLGRAGAGKTHTIREIDRLATLAGVECVYAAPTHAAKEILRGDGFSAETASQLLVDLRAGKTNLKGKLLVVDEAGMLSNRQGCELLRAAQRSGARVLLVGDEKQLTSVEAGDWLALLLKHSPLQSSVLSEIRRQKDGQYRDAMQAMSRGEVRNGLEQLDSHGWVHEGSDYIEKAAKSWLAANTEKEGSAILVAPTWAEIDRLNAIVRTDLAERGKLTGPERSLRALDLSDFTTAQRRVGRNYEPGMFVAPMGKVPGLKKGQWIAVTGHDKLGRVVLANGATLAVRAHGGKLQVAREIDIGVRVGDALMLQSNDKKLGVFNGDRVTVLEIKDDGLRVRQGRNGKLVTLPSSYRTFVHAYAVTAEKSQGATVDRAIVAGEKLDGRRTYVAASRGRRSIEIHLPDKGLVMKAARNEITAKDQALNYNSRRGPVNKPRRHSRVAAFLEWHRGHLARITEALRSSVSRVLGHARAPAQSSEIEPNTR